MVLNYHNYVVQSFVYFERATVPVLTSDKEQKHIILPTTFNFVVRRGNLRSYTLQNPPEVFWMFSPCKGYKECAAVCFAYMERSSSFIQNMWTT